MSPHHDLYRRLFLTSWILAFAVLVVAPSAWAQCQQPGMLGVFYIDLSTGFSIDTTGGAVTVRDAPVVNPDCADGSRMAVLEIEIPEECTQANVLAEYKGAPVDWTLNLGDSDTNNGFGGDAGTAGGQNAELQILGQECRIYNAASVPEEVDQLLSQGLDLTDGAIKLTVGDQTVGWGQPRGFLQSFGLERLFAIPGLVDGRSVYLGINRVIANDSRRGCGVRRVLVSFE